MDAGEPLISLVITPNVDGLFSADPGRPAFRRLGTLYASARSSSVFFSRMRKDRERLMSICRNPGPLRLLDARLPKVPAAGVAKAAGLSQEVTVWLAA